MKLENLKTPGLVLDIAKVKRNAAEMSRRVREFGADLRPHVKTHKCIEVARIQTDGHSGAITVSTGPGATAWPSNSTANCRAMSNSCSSWRRRSLMRPTIFHSSCERGSRLRRRGGHSSYGIPGYRSAEAWDRPLTRDRNRLPRFPDHWLPSKRNPHLGG